MGLLETGSAFALSLALLFYGIWQDRRPYRPGKRNYIPLMILSCAGCLVLGRHLATLLLK